MFLVIFTEYIFISKIFQDLYENVDYGVLYPNTKIKVKVNPSGVVMLKGEVQYPVDL